MSGAAQRFAYVPRDPTLGSFGLAPMLPCDLIGKCLVPSIALVDSGAAVNVMPYSLGQSLGFDWDLQLKSLSLSGNLAAIDAKAILVSAAIGTFPPVRLAFGWAKTDAVPLIFGQMNFFMEFDVCFFRSIAAFEVKPIRTP